MHSAIYMDMFTFGTIILLSMVSGSEEKVRVCKEYGAHMAINYREQNFAKEVLSFTGNRGKICTLTVYSMAYL